MKKSKFLKKSLAMLLALMLVVAMIPLSAAAAAPDVTQINVLVNNVRVATLDEGETSYEGSIANTAETFDLQVLTDDGAEVYYVDDVNTSAAKEIALNEVVSNVWTAAGINIHDFSNGADTFTIEIHVYDENDKNDPDVYTITLTREAVSVDNSIKNLILETIPTDDNPAVPQLGYSMPNENTISIIMPYGSGDEYRIKTLDLAPGATATPDEGATVKDGDTIAVTAGGQTRTYTLDITVASGFKSFETEEGLDAIVFPKDNAIAVLLPYGYSTDPANVKTDVDGHKYIEVTPVFEKDYESATVSYDVDDETYDADIAKLTSGTKVIVPVEFVWNREAQFNDRVKTWYSFGKQSDNDYTWEEYKETKDDKWSDFTGPIYNGQVANGSQKNIYTANLTLKYVEGTTRKYDVYFFETRANNEAAIHELTIGSETAEINGKDINITLPSNVNAAALDLTGASNKDATKLGIVASGNAKISFPAQNDVEVQTAEANNTHSTKEKFQAKTGTDTLNATSTVILRVTSEDGLTTTNYNLNVTVSDNYEAPAITSMNLQGPDGKTVPVKFDSSSNTYTFTVPYSVTEKANLAGYKLFYSKTVGATVTDADGNAFPKSGANVDNDGDGNVPDYIPDPGKVEKGKAIVVTSMKGNSVEKDEFFIVINRDNGSTNASLSEFAIVNNTDYDLIDRTYAAKIGDGIVDTDNTRSVTVKVYWTGYQRWQGSEAYSYGSTYATADPNAKLYYLTSTGVLHPVIPVVADEDEDTFGDDPNPTKWACTHDDILDLVVLSEKAWVDLGKPTGTISFSKLDTENITGYKKYDLEFEQLKAETTANLSAITLLDGSGWSDDLKIDVSNGRISGSVPYSFTSGDNETIAIYMDYTTGDNAFVLSHDTGVTSGDTVEKDRDSVPTADAVFNDNGGDPDKFTGACLILERNDDSAVVDNKVDVYIGSVDANGTITKVNTQMNRLLVLSEDTKDYAPFTFDLTYDEPNTEAIFTSFSVGGERGVIDNKNHTITVTLPYGTEYTYLVPTYDVSDYATVTVDDPALNGKDLRSGVTSVNFTSPRQFTVHAENEDHYTTYDVIIKVGERFSDVNPGDWFYENVMNAAAKDYVSGMGDGTFQPNGNTTRAQFAAMIANAMGFDAETDEIDVETAFVDVPATHWGAKAIAFCAENGYMNGDADGNFRPNANITRQEVASVLVNTFKLTNEGTKDFPDDAQIASWAKSNVYAAKAAGLMNGDEGTGNFRPTDYIKRAESASIMMNAFNKGYLK